MRNITFLLIILAFAGLSSCITPKDKNLLQDIPKQYPPEDASTVDYKIIPGDQLVLTVYTLNEDMRELYAMFISDRPASFSTQQNSSGTVRADDMAFLIYRPTH